LTPPLSQLIQVITDRPGSAHIPSEASASAKYFRDPSSRTDLFFGNSIAMSSAPERERPPKPKGRPSTSTRLQTSMYWL
jgi:hypothetical protein